MEYQVEEISPTKIKAEVKIPQDVMANAFQDEYRKLKQRVNIKGFRKGKVPIQYIKKLYKDSVKLDVLQKVINEALEKIIKEKNIKYVDEPNVTNVSEIEEDKDLNFTVEFYKIQDFEVEGYKDLEIEIEKMEVTDEMYEEAIQNILKRFTYYEDAENEVIKEGYQVLADIEAYDKAGNKIERYSGVDIVFTIGQNYFIPNNFDKYFIGLKKDDETEVSHTVNLDGEEKELNFKIKVKWIKKPVVPELNEDFISQFGDEYKDIEDFKRKVREQLEREIEERKKRIITDKALEKLREINKFEYPEVLLKKQIEFLKEAWRLPKDKELPEETMDNLRVTADRQIRNAIILNKIIEKEKIELKTEDIETKFKKIADMFNLDVEKVKEFYYKRPNDYNRFLDDLINDKAIDFILKNVKVKEVEKKEENEE